MFHRLSLLAVVILVVAACGTPTPTATPANIRLVRMAYASSAGAWLSGAISSFNAENVADAQGNIFRIEAKPLASGAIIEEMVGETPAYQIIAPAGRVWVDMMTARRRERSAAALPEITCTPVARTPIVMITWRSMAEVLGWPERQFTWNDITELALSPSAWQGYDHPEWGTLTYGHAHPVLSNAGLAALLGEAYAVAPLTPSDAASDTVKSYVRAVERSVARYGSDSTSLVANMAARGKNYVHVTIGYESDVIAASRVTSSDDSLIAIFPTETFLAEYTICGIGDAAPAADAFARYLLSDVQQRNAINAGFRPVSNTIQPSAPIDVNAKFTIIPAPPAEVIRALQDQWGELKRPLNITLVIDVSGSMGEAGKLEAAKIGARAFVERLADDDLLTLYTFTNDVRRTFDRVRVGDRRANILNEIGSLNPQQGTALYDAVAQSRAEMRADSSRINALVVLTDGRDTNSQLSKERMFQAIQDARGTVTIYAIGYGSDADETVMQEIATAGNGLYFRGDPETINQVYLEIATQVGGSRGLGR